MKIRGFVPFSDKTKEKIKDEYLDRPMAHIAKDLGCSVARLKGFFKRHNLVIPKDVLEQRKRNTRFQKGRESPWKGLKQTEFLTQEQIELSKRTRFKKGKVPPNKIEEGSVVLRNGRNGRVNKFYKTSSGKFILYQRVVWEREFGKIPDSTVVAFKDGDTLNCDPENLELKLRAEVMLENSVHDHDKELIPSMALVSRINHKIKELKNE